MGHKEHAFKQLTGDAVYNDALSPDYFTWLGYHYVNPLDIPFLRGYSLGGDYHAYRLDPEIKSGSLKNKPRPSMLSNSVSFATRLYFELLDFNGSSAFKDNFYFVFGLGWGYTWGKFVGEYFKFTPKSFETGYSGFYTYREFGGIYVGETFGLGYKIQLVRAPSVTVEDDLFDRKKPGDDKLKLDLEGVVTSFVFSVSF